MRGHSRMAEKYIFGGGRSMAQSFGRRADAERAYRNAASPKMALCRMRGICIKPNWAKKGSRRPRSGKIGDFGAKNGILGPIFRVSTALGGQNRRKTGCFRHSGAFGRFSEYRSHTTSPRRGRRGLQKHRLPDVWSRDDLVPVGLSGDRIAEYALKAIFGRRRSEPGCTYVCGCSSGGAWWGDSAGMPWGSSSGRSASSKGISFLRSSR